MPFWLVASSIPLLLHVNGFFDDEWRGLSKPLRRREVGLACSSEPAWTTRITAIHGLAVAFLGQNGAVWRRRMCTRVSFARCLWP